MFFSVLYLAIKACLAVLVTVTVLRYSTEFTIGQVGRLEALVEDAQVTVARYNTILEPVEEEWYAPVCLTDNPWYATSPVPKPFYKELAMLLMDDLYLVKHRCRDRPLVFYVTVAFGIASGLILVYALVSEAYSLIRKTVGLDSPIGNPWGSAWTTACMTRTKQYPRSAQGMRVHMRGTKLAIKQMPSAHSHPTAAMYRNAASETMRRAVKQMGLQVYVVQQSNNDVKNDLPGCRSYYWSKDLEVQSSVFKPNDNDVLVLVDVDHYLDMNVMLADNYHPYMIYTFQPTAVAKDGKESDDYSFTFDVNNKVHYWVTGGAEYVHEVWNYGTDVLTVRKSKYGGLFSVVCTYHVDRISVDEHHQIVCLTPSSRVVGPFLPSISGTQLKRLAISDAGINSLRIVGTEGNHTSIGTPGALKQVTIPTATLDVLKESTLSSKIKPSPAHCMRLAEGNLDNVQDAMQVASILTKEAQHVTAATVFPHTDASPVFQAVTRNPFSMEENPKPVVKAFMKPFTVGAYVPTKTRATELLSIHDRVTSPSVGDDFKISHFVVNCINEYVGIIVGSDKHTLVPVDLEEIYERQHRPSQRAILNEGCLDIGADEEKFVRTFLKGESKRSLKPPRNVSTESPENKVIYSAYMYALMNFFADRHRFPWYAFNKDPKAIADIVADLAKNCGSHLLETDFELMDARIGVVPRMLCLMLSLTLFKVEHHTGFETIYSMQYNRQARTPFGFKYWTGYSQLSGGLDTALFNSLVNGFYMFLCNRLTNYDAADAYRRIGIVGGDDGLLADVFTANAEKAAELIGQKVTIDLRAKSRNDRVTFLSRHFSMLVWNGEPSSMCDVQRALEKFHLCSGKYDHPIDKFYEKLRGFRCTDANSPVFCDLIQAVKGLDERSPEKTDEVSWWAQWPSEVQWPNINTGNWMGWVSHDLMPNFDFGALQVWCSQINCDEDLLSPPNMTMPSLDPLRSGAAVECDGFIIGEPKEEPVLVSTTVAPVPKANQVSKWNKAVDRGETHQMKVLAASAEKHHKRVESLAVKPPKENKAVSGRQKAGPANTGAKPTSKMKGGDKPAPTGRKRHG